MSLDLSIAGIENSISNGIDSILGAGMNTEVAVGRGIKNAAQDVFGGLGTALEITAGVQLITFLVIVVVALWLIKEFGHELLVLL